jgi:hypothetical protein
MAADEVHAPTNAGPGAYPAPTNEIPVAGAPGQGAVQERPEVQVGIAFAGGLLAAMILKRFGR